MKNHIISLKKGQKKNSKKNTLIIKLKYILTICNTQLH